MLNEFTPDPAYRGVRAARWSTDMAVVAQGRWSCVCVTFKAFPPLPPPTSCSCSPEWLEGDPFNGNFYDLACDKCVYVAERWQTDLYYEDVYLQGCWLVYPQSLMAQHRRLRGGSGDDTGRAHLGSERVSVPFRWCFTCFSFWWQERLQREGKCFFGKVLELLHDMMSSGQHRGSSTVSWFSVKHYKNGCFVTPWEQMAAKV